MAGGRGLQAGTSTQVSAQIGAAAEPPSAGRIRARTADWWRGHKRQALSDEAGILRLLRGCAP